MVRPLPPGPSSLRNRTRINNKSRLTIRRNEDFDADDIIPVEEDEKHRLQQSVLGVDQEDANEHHLQQVLSQAAGRSVRSKKDVPAAFIPIPDSTGIVSNYEELYPSDRWKDPATYIYSSLTVEEACDASIANGFTYYMDERDKEWLDKNNEEARGEGTSAQGAVSASGTRTSARSARAKGKEPDVAQPVVITEDEFELVMGLFEKTTHEKTEYLHHSLETGMAFPAFTDYHDVFSFPLAPATFTTFAVPPWIPSAPNLCHMARVVYPYWKSRRIERGGHRIIPALNGDEADTLNESYVCFRRREIKAVRKTRATQVSTTDKLSRLQAEFSFPLQLAQQILQRENVKRESAKMSQNIWEKRAQLADLKRKNPSLGEKGDEELLIDKERPTKRLESSRIKNAQKAEPSQARQEVLLRPAARLALIHANMESSLAKQREKDHSWEDSLDCGYQSTLAPFASRLFKFIPPVENTAPKSTPSDIAVDEPRSSPQQPRPVRLRYGRGGRLMVDRRLPPNSVSSIAGRSRPTSGYYSVDDSMDVDTSPEDSDRAQRLAERWRFDADDVPATGPWTEDDNRVLVDDYETKNLVYTMSLLTENDQGHLATNQSLVIVNSEGRQEVVVPYRLGVMPGMMRGPPPSASARALAAHGMSAASGSSGAGLVNGASISISQQMRMPNQRLPGNSPMRQQGPIVASMANSVPSSSPSQSASTPDVNGTSRGAMTIPHVDPSKADVSNMTHGLTNGIQQPAEGSVQGQENGHANFIQRPKSTHEQPQPSMPTNGYHLLPTMNGYSGSTIPSNVPYVPHMNGQSSALSMQQMQTLKTAFANGTAVQQDRPVAPYMQMSTNGNLNLKLPPSRQMQWAGSIQRQNHHSPSPIPSIAQSQSPPRPSQTAMAMASPSMQHQQL
ncbi:polycomb enhancer protein [Mycena floridula]|nr:polycomb enhancer protein [Mycena floridula]